jgi:hypothetical protein
MPGRIIHRGAWSDRTAFRAGDDEELERLVSYRGEFGLVIRAEGTSFQVMDGHPLDPIELSFAAIVGNDRLWFQTLAFANNAHSIRINLHHAYTSARKAKGPAR